MLTEHDVRHLLTQARQFYKGQLKTSNKKYVSSSTDKGRRRNQNASIAQGEIQDSRADLWLAGVKYIDYGKELVEGDIPRAGNCGEVAAVTAYTVSLAAQTQGHAGFSIYVGSVGDEFHAFVLLAENSSTHSDGALSTVTNMANNHDNISGLWIIDAFMNSACLAQDYGTTVRAKLSEWNRQGKYIEENESTGPLDPELWWQSLMALPIQYEPQAQL